MCQLHQSYIEKSNENWNCVEKLMPNKTDFANVIASRMYYSIFLLVKCSMVYNMENNVDCDEKMKMSEDGSHRCHPLVRDCVSYIKPAYRNEIKDLWDLRVRADYERGKVDCDELIDAYQSWRDLRKTWLNNLIQSKKLEL